MDHIPLDEITNHAREVRFGRTVLLWTAAVLYAVGWVAAKVLGGAWLSMVWSWTAVRVGWQEASNSRRADGSARPVDRQF